MICKVDTTSGVVRMIDNAQLYKSQRASLGASNMVATSQPLAAQAGVNAMHKGGNAVDAAIATAITLTVVEPTGNGIGSDAFALVWDGENLTGLNGSGRSPALWDPEYFSRYRKMPQFGWDAVTVPGAVSLWSVLSEAYGRLPFESLFEMAIEYAYRGFQVGFRTAYDWQHGPAEWYKDFDEFGRHFLPPPKVGQRVVRRELGETLQELSVRPESLYSGSLAEKIEYQAVKDGGALRVSDLSEHETDWVVPVTCRYRNTTVHEIPPNGQGLAVLIALGILDTREPGQLDSADGVHLQIEAMKIALRAAADHISDAETMQVSISDLLDKDSLARVANDIGINASILPPAALPSSFDTVYLSTADAGGMMVSFIQSNYFGFGSGIVIPQTGIALQNRGWGFSLEQGHPNQVAPSKKPFHTIIPGFLTCDGQAMASFGVMGGPMQAQGHVQMVTRLVDHKQNPQAASDAPRWQVLGDYSISVEPGFPEEIVSNLEKRGHKISYASDSWSFGGAQLIIKTDNGYVGGSDHRKEGCVAGF